MWVPQVETTWAALPAKRQAKASVTRSGLAIWRTPRIGACKDNAMNSVAVGLRADRRADFEDRPAGTPRRGGLQLSRWVLDPTLSRPMECRVEDQTYETVREFFLTDIRAKGNREATASRANSEDNLIASRFLGANHAKYNRSAA